MLSHFQDILWIFYEKAPRIDTCPTFIDTFPMTFSGFRKKSSESHINTVVFWIFWRPENQNFHVFVILSQNVTFYALKRLSDWMVAWRFRKSSPKHQIWSGKRSSCEFSEWNSEKSPMALFPLRNRWSGSVRNRNFPGNQ